VYSIAAYDPLLSSSASTLSCMLRSAPFQHCFHFATSLLYLTALVRHLEVLSTTFDYFGPASLIKLPNNPTQLCDWMSLTIFEVRKKNVSLFQADFFK
jgi:hypothetical protein